MSLLPRPLLPLTLAAPWLALAPVEHPTFAPKAGTTLTRKIDIQGELELEEMKLFVGGQDMSGAMGGELEMSMKHHQTLTVTDTIESVADGRPKRLVRTYDEIGSKSESTGSTPMGSMDTNMELESELEGSKVVFNFDGGDYAIEFAEGEKGDAKLLEGLEEDLDLRGFLPESEVKAGESWKFDGAVLRTILVPGGDLKLRPVEGSDASSGMENMNFSPSDMLGEIEGTFTATFTGTREEGGAKVAIITLKIEGKSSNDMTEKMQSMTEKMSEQTGATMKIDSFDGEWEYEAEGELLWNLEAGVVHSLNLSGELQMTVDVQMSVDAGGRSAEMQITQSYGGNQTVILTAGS